MDSYPCPACGGVATAATGCRSCGRPHDPDAAALALFQRTVASLEAKKRALTSDQQMLRTQLAHASAQRDSLRRKVRDRLSEESGGKGVRGLIGRGRASHAPGGPATARPGGPGGGPAGPGTSSSGPHGSDAGPGAGPSGAEAGRGAGPAAADPRAARPSGPGARPAGPAGSSTATTSPTPPSASAGPRFSPTAPGRGPGGADPDAPPPLSPTPPPAIVEHIESPADRMRAAIVVPPQRAGRRPRGARLRSGPGSRRHPGDVAETTPRTMQAAVLVLGGLLLAGAVIVLTVDAFDTLGTLGRVAVLAAVTAVALVLPIVLADRELTATAETVAAVALLMVLLDGYVAWSEGLLGADSMPATVYFGLVCAATAGIAALYSIRSHLVAPRYATLIVLQPVVPLLAYDWILGPAGWTITLAAVALLDLGFAVALTRAIERQAAVQRAADRQVAVSIVDDQLAGGVRRPDVLMRDLAWVLFAIAYGAAAAYGIAAVTTADTLPAVVRAASVLLITAAIGIAGALSWRRGGVSDVAAGVATLAVIFAFARVGAVALPGHTLVFIAGAVAIAAAAVPFLPEASRRGPRLAGAASATVTAVLVVFTALPIVAAPIRAAMPVWRADLDRYGEIVSASAGRNGWQLVASALLLTVALAIMLPAGIRTDAMVAGGALTVLVAPGALSLGWLLTPAVTVLAAVVAGAVGLAAVTPRTAWTCLISAVVLGGYAAATSLVRPGATAVTLGIITAAGAAIALSPRNRRVDRRTALVVDRVRDGAIGGALAAAPGAAAAAAAILVMGLVSDSTVVLVAGFIALAASLCFAAMIQVARGEPSRPHLIGASVGVVAMLVAAFIAPGTSTLDMGVALAMVLGLALLWYAPSLEARQAFGQTLTGNEIAAAAVTIAAVAAFTRAVAAALPGVELVAVALLVLGLSTGVRGLPEAWRRGPVVGGAVVGGLLWLYAAVLATAAAIGVIRAASPIWNAPVDHRWHQTASQFIDVGWQVPVALLILAVAALVSLPHPWADDAAASAIAFAAASAPVAFGLGWASPLLLGWLVATGLGAWAAYAKTRRSAYPRLIAAGMVGTFAAGASLVSREATAATLFGLALSGTMVAILAAALGPLTGKVQGEPAAEPGHRVTVGGSGVTAALLALPAAAAATAATLRHPQHIIIIAAFATSCLGLAVAALVCTRTPRYLGYVTAGAAGGATITALATAPTSQPTAVYAAGAALVGVLAELVRAGHRVPERTWQAARGFRPGRTSRPVMTWRLVAQRGGFSAGVAAAAGLPAAIAVIIIGPAVVAALVGPYQWVLKPWTGTPSNGSDLGWFNQWIGDGSHVIAAVVLMLAAGLMTVGVGGDHDEIVNRAVMVLIPGVALTMLIAPAAFAAPWPVQPTAALLVATMAGLGLALTNPPPDRAAETPQRVARRLVFVIAVLAAGAGMAGSLATRSQTITALAGSVIVGLIGAIGGKYGLARMVGWHVAGGAAVLLALTSGLAAGLRPTQCAFPVLIVSAVLLLVAAILPRVRPRSTTGREVMVVEATAYAGGLLAILLTFRSAPYAAAVLTALGAMLGLAAARPGRAGKHRAYLIIAAAISLLVAIWLLLSIGDVALPEAYTLPFAVLALITGLIELRRRPELGSWVAYGPALVAGFAPSLAIVVVTDSSATRRVLLILAAVITAAIGAVQRQKAPVEVGAVVTVIAMLHEVFLLRLPWPVLVLLFTGTGALLVTLGAWSEKRSRLNLRGRYSLMR